MNDRILGASSLAFSVGLFLYAVSRRRRILSALLGAVGFNAFPFFLMSYVGNHRARFLSIPIAYFPFMAVLAAAWVSCRGRILRQDVRIGVLSSVLLGYVLISSLLFAHDYRSFVVYFGEWVFYIGGMLALSMVVATTPPSTLVRFYRELVFLVSICALLGVLRFAGGWASPLPQFNDSNFFPLINRNSTAFFMVTTIPIALMLSEAGELSRRHSMFVLGAMTVGLVLLQSRMGALGLLFVLSAYGVLKYKKQVGRLVAATAGTAMIALVLWYSPLGTRIGRRFDKARSAAELVVSSRRFDPYDTDFNRLKNLSAGLTVARKHFWFGTGLGLENYLEAIRTDSPELPNYLVLRSHNAYVSYLGELGVFGLGLLVSLLGSVGLRLGRGTSVLFSDSTARKGYGVLAASVFLMLTVNEYVNSPLLWVVLGLGLGVQRPRNNFHPGVGTSRAEARQRVDLKGDRGDRHLSERPAGRPGDL